MPHRWTVRNRRLILVFKPRKIHGVAVNLLKIMSSVVDLINRLVWRPISTQSRPVSLGSSCCWHLSNHVQPTDVKTTCVWARSVMRLFSESLFTASDDVIEMILTNLLKFLFFLHILPVERLRMLRQWVCAVFDKLLLPLLVSKLACQARNRARNFCQSSLFIMLNSEMRKEFLDVFRPNPLRRKVVQLFELSSSFKSLAFLGDFFLDKPVNLCL